MRVGGEDQRAAAAQVVLELGGQLPAQHHQPLEVGAAQEVGGTRAQVESLQTEAAEGRVAGQGRVQGVQRLDLHGRIIACPVTAGVTGQA